MSERDADNRRLATWLGCTSIQACSCEAVPLRAVWPDGHTGHVNFFTDPAASWLLLKKLPNVRLSRLPASRSWACDYDWCTWAKEGNASVGPGHALGMEDPDPFTAIALAALKLIDSQEGK